MTPNEYQQLALRTDIEVNFVKDDVKLSRLMHGAIGMATEVGEIQDMLKKHLMYGKPFDAVNVLEECGDVLWYIALALDSCDFTLEQAMERNIAKLRVRFPDKFSTEKANNRDLNAERAALENGPTVLDTRKAYFLPSIDRGFEVFHKDRGFVGYYKHRFEAEDAVRAINACAK